MAPSPSSEPIVAASDAEVLLDIAEATIITALVGRQPTLAPLHTLPPVLHARVGAFVTLTVAGRLNGCIGTVEGVEPLGHAVARLALSAAFADPRLPALQSSDYAHLTIELSLLSPLTPITAGSRADLLAALQPDHDGVVVAHGAHQGLFLPSVWQQLPDPDDFLDQLWLKAGLRPGTWPPGLRTFRFTARRHTRHAGTTSRSAAA